MAGSFDVMRKVMRFKLQLTDQAESATVLKILQKLKDLDITLDILAETGIGKTVNSLRRHEQAGEFAKSLVRGWKRLVPKESTSHTEDGNASANLSVKDKLDDQSYPNNGSLTMEDLNNNCLAHDTQGSSNEAPFKTDNNKADSKRQYEEQKQFKDQMDSQEKSKQDNQNNSRRDMLKKKIETQEDDLDYLVASKEKKTDKRSRNSGDKSLLENKNSEDTHQNARFDPRETLRSNSDSGRSESEKESNKKSKPTKEGKESFSFESSDKCSKLADVRDNRYISRSSEANRKRKKTWKEKHDTLKYNQTENEEHPKHKNKKAKIKHGHKGSDNEEPSMSFESYLNYDLNVLKRKERSGVKKPPKKIRTAVKEEATKDHGMKALKAPVMPMIVTSPKKLQESLMDLMNLPLPDVLPECEKPFSVDYFERKAERGSDFCDVTEESEVFTGQRLNRKMQVYSGAKTIFLPTMMSLHQQCIRTLQNNINLLYETGGVPFEILEPVLERCTPEQLLRIEECNPIYIGVTDHLWGKHCQRDFKDSKLQEYESWKEMYIRLSEEREQKLQRLTKSIVSAHSNKPKCRQVKMAFIHTVAKPPRDVRIQQEIHGTAVKQPHQLRCSVKDQDSKSRLSCNELSRSNSTTSGPGNMQDPRKKTRVAPMMAKSLKAFKKQLGRR